MKMSEISSAQEMTNLHSGSDSTQNQDSMVRKDKVYSVIVNVINISYVEQMFVFLKSYDY